MESYIYVHSFLGGLSLYFIVYSVIKIQQHWKDGKERAHISRGRLIVKIAGTVLMSIIQLIHVADYNPGKFSKVHFVTRTCYFIITAIAWLFSSVSVYFDYNRRLQIQWRGQRGFWMIGLISNVTLLSMNMYWKVYSYNKNTEIAYAFVQICLYGVSIVISIVLFSYAIFRPDDFTVIPHDMFFKLKRSSLVFDEGNESIEDNIQIKIRVGGYKIKPILNTSVIHYNFNIGINDTFYSISKSLIDFESLDKALRGKFPKDDFPNLKFPEFSMELLRKYETKERGDELCKYLNSICKPDFMTPDLLNFLQIEGNYRDLLTYKHNLVIEERFQNNDSIPRAESSVFLYYNPASPSKYEHSSSCTNELQWLIKIEVPSYRFDETTQILDYYLRTSIPKLGIEKLRPYKYTDFCNIHKSLKKIAGNSISFPSTNYGHSLKEKEKIATESRKSKLEYYFSQVFNDPAYLCKEVLDFIGCDADLSQILDLIPNTNFRIAEETTWESDISDDSSHYINYSITIGKTTNISSYEVQWKISKRFREFDILHKKLQQRHNSALLKNYMARIGKCIKDYNVPALPSKTIAPLNTLEEIEARTRALESYIKELFNNPSVLCSYIFREFIEDKD